MKSNLSLVDRVSLFFLASLAAVLVCYSVVLYLTLRHQLQRQFDEQLHAAFQTLVAAVEVEQDDVKFEPSDHTISLGTETGAEDIRWVIVDERGLPVDRSRNLAPGKPSDDALLASAQQHTAGDAESTDVGHWRVLQKRLAASAPKPAAERDPLEREALLITVGRSPDDLNANLRMIGALVILVPLAVGLTAAFVGRKICRRALQPVRDMASQARTMVATDADRRLPVAPTHDELAEFGEAFNAVLDRLFESLERRRRFAGDAAHQLRTPLTAILGQLDVALRRERPAESYRETLSVVREQAFELRQIIESLLFLARAENEATVPDAERLPVAQWLNAYVAERAHRSPGAELRLSGEALDSHMAVITASPLLLKQLLDNLVDNALKYADPTAPVEIVANVRGPDVEISVRDQGPGIAAEDLPHLFQPFFRSPQARQQGKPGTGLGLAVAARIATALGGQLNCESTVGQGSRFTLTLPRTVDVAVPASAGS